MYVGGCHPPADSIAGVSVAGGVDVAGGVELAGEEAVMVDGVGVVVIVDEVGVDVDVEVFWVSSMLSLCSV